MITLAQAHDWLSQLTPTYLSEKSQFSKWQLENSSISDAEKDRLIDLVITSARESDNPYELAEVQVFCARAQADRNRLGHAHNLLEMAMKFYAEKKDRVRQAIVLWMMSIIEWKQLDNLTAHSSARAARELLEQAAREMLLDKKDARNIGWVQGRLQEMEEDISGTPEEAHYWLNQFEGGHLRISAVQIKDAITAALREKQFNKVYRLIESLLAVTRSAESLEKPEAIAFCGLVSAQMGNTREAVRLMRQACAEFLPESHYQAAARWMLAMTLFNQPLETSAAVNMANQAIEGMEKLKIRAMQNNRPYDQSWYEQHAGLMRTILNKKIREQEKV